MFGNPIPGYASLRVAEILPRLAELDAAGLAAVEAAERAGSNRTTVLNRILRLRDAAGLNRPMPEDDADADGAPVDSSPPRRAARTDPANRAAAARRRAAAKDARQKEPAKPGSDAPPTA